MTSPIADPIADLFEDGDGAGALVPGGTVYRDLPIQPETPNLPTDVGSQNRYNDLPVYRDLPVDNLFAGAGSSSGYGAFPLDRGPGIFGGSQPVLAPAAGAPMAAPPARPWTPYNEREQGPTGTERNLRMLGGFHGSEGSSTGGRVLYFNRTLRERYAVTMGRKVLRDRSGLELDTAAVSMHYRQKRFRGSGKATVGAASWGASRAGKEFDPMEAYQDALIWVCAPGPDDRPRFYSHVCKLNRFHHSSFMAGGGVIGAGEWVVKSGMLRYVSANSGHYRPDLQTFYNAVLHMAPAFTELTEITMYDQAEDRWVNRPVKLFISSPSGNGRFKTHPRG